MTPADSVTLRFFEDASRAASLEQLVESFGACAAAHGFQRAACVSIATPGQPVSPKTLFGWRNGEWGDLYVDQKLYRVDRTIQAVFSSIEPFSWDEIEAASGPETASVFAMARETGAMNALVVPVHGPLGEVLAVIMISESDQTYPRELRQKMHVAASLFATCGLTLMERAAEPPGPNLSRRELQCIYWVAEGKSDWEIGKILQISDETVAWHVQNAKRKLGVVRRAQLPAAAWRRGLLVDESPD